MTQVGAKAVASAAQLLKSRSLFTRATKILAFCYLSFVVVTTALASNTDSAAEFDRGFDENIKRVPFAWILVKDDEAFRRKVLEATRAAYLKSGWPGANRELYALDQHRIVELQAQAL